MGNYSSCFKLQDMSSKMAKLVDAQGQVKQVELPTTVAELMLENPGFAISPVDKLLRTRRVPVMKADDMLLGRKVYLLVPVDKVNSRLCDLQLATIDTLVCSRKKITRMTRGSSKVMPFVENGESLDDLVKSLSEKCNKLGSQKKGLSKVWAPVLEPILETC